jgi:hypothetical protein
MRFQKNPSNARLFALRNGASQIAIDEPSCERIRPCERLLVEVVRNKLAGIVSSGPQFNMDEEAPALDEVAESIGDALRKLNGDGLYLYAQPQLDGPFGDNPADGEGEATHTVMIRAIRAQQATA